MPADISGNVILAELERLADLPGDEATWWTTGSGACAGCLGHWGPGVRPFARLTLTLREGGDGALLCRDCTVPSIARQVAQARVPGREVQLWSTADPAVDAVTDADREWFLANPRRRFRLRPTSLDELPAGTIVVPGMVTVVARVADGARMRCFVKVPPHRRRDTDRCCRSLLPDYAKAEITRLRPPALR
jgi:hypothetical protein